MLGELVSSNREGRATIRIRAWFVLNKMRKAQHYIVFDCRLEDALLLASAGS